MANWDVDANEGMFEVKQMTSASDAEMSQLRSAIGNWADTHPNARQFFPFGRFRGHGVCAMTAGGWIKQVEYGDRC
jgi:hypothetical protein